MRNPFLHQAQKNGTLSLERLIIALGLLLTLWSGAVNPLFEPPDELLHYRFVRHLLDERTLPVQEIDGEPSHSHHPPLYYLLGAALTAGLQDSGYESEPNPHWTSYRSGETHRDNKNLYLRDPAHNFPWHDTALVVHTLRLFSTALFAGTLLLTLKITYALFPRSPTHRLLMLTFVALNPMLIYLSSAFNNDNLLILIGTALLLTTIRAFRAKFTWQYILLLGILYGLAILTKLNGVVLGGVWGIMLLLTLFYKSGNAQTKPDVRSLLSTSGRGLVILAIALLMSAWWFVRNIELYGDLLGFRVHFAVWGHRTQEEFSFLRFFADSRYAFSNFFGRFGYGQINLPSGIYGLFALIMLLAMIGGIRQLMRKPIWDVRPVWFILLTSAAVFVLAMFYYLVRVPVGANARYVFPVITAIAALLAQGLMGLDWVQYRPKFIPSIFAAMTIYAIGWFIPWTYAAPARVSQIDPAYCWLDTFCISHPTIKSRIHQGSGEQEIVFDACWQTNKAIDANYVFFVHLLDVHLNPLGGRDTHLGNGRYPTSLHKAGTAFCETLVVPISAEIPHPIAANIEIGIYESQTGERPLAIDQAGNTIEVLYTNRVRVAPTVVQSAELPPPYASFNGVDLLSYEWIEQEDNSYLLRTVWQSTAPLPVDYTLFAHLLDTDNTLLTQSDGPLQNGAFPTSLWTVGDLIIDERAITLSTAASHLRLGLYNPLDSLRLPRISSNTLPDAIDLPAP